jgi:replication factor C subunit 1
LFQLIRTLPAHGGTGKVGQKAAEKKVQEEKKMEEIAKGLDDAVRMRENDRAASGLSPVNAQLWTEKYAPASMKDICGNKGLVEKLRKWLHDWFIVFQIVLISGHNISKRISKSLVLMVQDSIAR